MPCCSFSNRAGLTASRQVEAMAMRRAKTIGTPGNTHRSQPYNTKAAGGGLSLKLDKKLGQHLLKNPGVLDKIIIAAEIKSTDTVLEVGPGALHHWWKL